MHAMQFEVWRTLILDAHRPIRVTAMPHTMQGQAGCARARERETHIKFSLSYRRGTATTLSFRLL